MARILAIDDDALVLSTLRELLEIDGHEVTAAADGESAIDHAGREIFDMMICDLSLPGIGGSALVETLREIAPTVPIVTLTGFASIESAVSAMKAGANDYATKPVRLDDLRTRVTRALEKSRRQLNRRQRELRSMFLKSIRSLVLTLEAKDAYTKNHSLKVAAVSDRIAETMGFTRDARRRIHLAALLHDVGKIGISEKVLLKNGPLTPSEFEHICEHPLIGERILQPIMGAYSDVVAAVKHEHERFDGRGYPSGLRGEAVPLASRIIMVADCYDAITSNRPYRAAQADDAAFDVIQRGRGTQFDPQVADAFLQLRKTLTPSLAEEATSLADAAALSAEVA